MFTYVSDVERLATRVEAPLLGSPTLPLVSATDPRIGTAWSALEMFRDRTARWQYGAVKRAFGEPAAFFISSERRGYTVAWSDVSRSAIHPLAANDNVRVTTRACHGASREPPDASLKFQP